MGLVKRELRDRLGFDSATNRKILDVNVWELSLQGDLSRSFFQDLLTKTLRQLPFAKRLAFRCSLVRRRLNFESLLRQAASNAYRVVIALLPITLQAQSLGGGPNPLGQVLASNPFLAAGLSLVLALWLIVKPAVEFVKEKATIDLDTLLKKAPYELQVSMLTRLREDFKRLTDIWIGQDRRGRLVVFVDDLDRCPPTMTPGRLEAIKLFLTIDRCIYVLSLDERVIATSIELRYGRPVTLGVESRSIDGARYLEKIVQVPFMLPSIDLSDIEAYIDSFAAQWPDERCKTIFSAGLPRNPRQIKRAVNVFLLLWDLAERRRKKIGPSATPLRLAKFVALQTAYPQVFQLPRSAPPLLQRLELASLAEDGPVEDPQITTLRGEAGLSELFQLLKDVEEARFAALNEDELAAFFSLARRVPGETEFAAPRNTSPTRLDAEIVRGFQQLPIVPTPAVDFTGRERELALLKSMLTSPHGSGNSGAAIAVVNGMGGAGKTALALRAAHDVADQFSDGQLYRSLRGIAGDEVSSADVLAGFLRTLTRSDTLPASTADRARLYRDQLHGKRILIVLDDAADAEQVRPLLPDTPGCAAIITSRRRLGLPGAGILQLTVLGEAEGLALLTRLVGADRVRAEPDASKRLIELCGGLPLALRIVGGHLASHNRTSLAEYAERLRDASSRLRQLGRGGLEVSATIELSYRELEPKSQRLFRLLGILETSDFAVDELAALADAGPAEIEVPLQGLIDVGLIRHTGEPGRFSTHPLVQLFARGQLAEEEAGASTSAAAAFEKAGDRCGQAKASIRLASIATLPAGRVGTTAKVGGANVGWCQPALQVCAKLERGQSAKDRLVGEHTGRPGTRRLRLRACPGGRRTWSW
jgi:KAP family P-loop domain/NB-ARC domain